MAMILCIVFEGFFSMSMISSRPFHNAKLLPVNQSPENDIWEYFYQVYSVLELHEEAIRRELKNQNRYAP